MSERREDFLLQLTWFLVVTPNTEVFREAGGRREGSSWVPERSAGLTFLPGQWVTWKADRAAAVSSSQPHRWCPEPAEPGLDVCPHSPARHPGADLQASLEPHAHGRRPARAEASAGSTQDAPWRERVVHFHRVEMPTGKGTEQHVMREQSRRRAGEGGWPVSAGSWGAGGQTAGSGQERQP